MLIWRSDLEELEYPEHLENLINRKITIFYIEAVLNFFFQLRKKIFFWDRKKNLKKNRTFSKIWKKIKILIEKSIFSSNIFTWKNQFFYWKNENCPKKVFRFFQENFSSLKTKYCFFEKISYRSEIFQRFQKSYLE